MSQETTVEGSVEGTQESVSGEATQVQGEAVASQVQTENQPDLRDAKIASLEAQLQTLTTVISGSRQPQGDAPIDEDQLEQEWNANPSKGIKSVYSTIAERDRAFKQEMDRQRIEFEDRLAEASPDYSKYAAQIKVIDSMPVGKMLTKSEKLEMARKFAPQPQVKPIAKAPGAVGGTASAQPQVTQVVDRAEKFRPYLELSGAIRSERKWSDGWAMTRGA